MKAKKGAIGVAIAAVMAAAFMNNTAAHSEGGSDKPREASSSETQGSAAVVRSDGVSDKKTSFSGLKDYIKKKRQDEIEVDTIESEKSSDAQNKTDRRSSESGKSGGSRSGKKKENPKKAASDRFVDTFMGVFEEEVKKAMDQRNAGEESDAMLKRINEIAKTALDSTFSRMKQAVTALDDLAPGRSREWDESLDCLGSSDPMCDDN